MGSVSDTAGTPLVGVEIRALQANVTTRSDEQGQYRLLGVSTGEHLIQARRLGFRPETLRVSVGAAGGSASFRLREVAARLPAVVVRRRRERYTGRLAGYYERLESGTNGVFVTRDLIDLGNPRSLTNVLQRVAGVEVVRGRSVRLRGRMCAPLVWLDGTAMPAGEVDLNTFAPNSLEGIEIYMSASGAPIRYQGTRDTGACGTILLWSRGKDTDARRQVTTAPPSAVESMEARGEIFVADQVDVRAQPSSTRPISVVYPPELLVAGTTGLVIAEFVVDAAGRPEPETFGLLASTHPLFARAVQEALREATFTPAMRGGSPVRQLVQLPFRFEPPGQKDKRGG